MRWNVFRCMGIAFASLVTFAPIALAAPPATERPSAKGPPAWQRLVFHGWSGDSRWVAYTRTHTPVVAPGQPPAEPRVQRMHRRIRDGRFDGFGKMVGGDVETFAKDHGYRVEPAVLAQQSPHHFTFNHRDIIYTLDVDIGRTLGFTLKRADTVIFRHTFDRLYVGFEPELHPSPDHSQALLVFHLDSGWDSDAAVFPLRLAAPRPRTPKPVQGAESTKAPPTRSER